MMTYLARNYARRGIMTNLIHPCVIETELLRSRYADAAAKAALAAQIPVGRAGRPEDIAGLVAYLASPWRLYLRPGHPGRRGPHLLSIVRQKTS